MCKASRSSSLEELKALKELRELKEKSETRAPDFDSPKIVPGAVTFQNLEAMARMSSASPVGTLAYIADEEAVLVRVNKGWQYISLGSLVPIPTELPPTSTDRTRPLFESSNFLSGQPLPMDGPALHLAALNEPQDGGLKGARGADYACYRQARRAGLRGTYRAFLSSRVQNLDSLVRASDRNLPVVNIKGDVLFNSWQDIFNGSFFAQQPRIYSFSGKNIITDLSWPQKYVWHGALANGERDVDRYCEGWESDSIDSIGLASSLTGGKLLGQEPLSCSHRFAVLCVEVASTTHNRRRRRIDPVVLSPEEYENLLEYLAKSSSHQFN